MGNFKLSTRKQYLNGNLSDGKEVVMRTSGRTFWTEGTSTKALRCNELDVFEEEK